MKKIVRFLLTVSLMLSLSLVSFASPQLVPVDEDDLAYGRTLSSSGIIPYALVPMTGEISILTARTGTWGDYGTWTTLISEDDLYIGSGGMLSYIGSTSSKYQNAFFVRRNDYLPTNTPYYWWNFIGKVTDANGYVLQASDFQYFGIQEVSDNGTFGVNKGATEAASDNVYSFDDGYLQIAISGEEWDVTNSGYALYACISNSSVVAPVSFEIEKFEAYSGESSSTAYPFTFGSGAHSTTPPVPEVKDPNDHTQYGSASDQVEWYNDAFGGAVSPELGDRMGEATDMLLQQEEIEQDVIADFQQYSSQVDPATLTFPTAVLNGMSFIGSTFMSSYNNLGDISFVISLSMMIGVVLALIGRGEGALAREKANARYERRRDENRAYYEQMRNKK